MAETKKVVLIASMVTYSEGQNINMSSRRGAFLQQHDWGFRQWENIEGVEEKIKNAI